MSPQEQHNVAMMQERAAAEAEVERRTKLTYLRASLVISVCLSSVPTSPTRWLIFRLSPVCRRGSFASRSLIG